MKDKTIFIIIITILISFTVLALLHDYKKDVKYSLICENEGFEGLLKENCNLFNCEYRCYNYINSTTGFGHEIEKSGLIEI